MNALPIDDDRKRRHAIGAETGRSDEAILDLDQPGAFTFQCLDHMWRRSRLPDGNLAVRSVLYFGGERHVFAGPQQGSDGRTLPERETERRRDITIAVDEIAPESTKPHGRSSVDLFLGVGVYVGPRVHDVTANCGRECGFTSAGQAGKTTLPDRNQRNPGDRSNKRKLVVCIDDHAFGTSDDVPRVRAIGPDELRIVRSIRGRALRIGNLHQRVGVLRKVRLLPPIVAAHPQLPQIRDQAGEFRPRRRAL